MFHTYRETKPLHVNNESLNKEMLYAHMAAFYTDDGLGWQPRLLLNTPVTPVHCSVIGSPDFTI